VIVCACVSLSDMSLVCALCLLSGGHSMQIEKELAVVEAATDQLRRQRVAAVWEAATPEPVLVPPAGAADGEEEPGK
jgi:hypothetical protein